MTFSPNLLADLLQMWHYEFVQHAFEAGTIIAVIAGITGYFVVLRRSAFTAHAFSEIGFAGAAGAVLLGLPPIAGLLMGSTLGGLAIAALGRRAANRDTQIGIVLAFALGLGLLFISLYNGYASEAYSILFGEITGISGGATASYTYDPFGQQATATVGSTTTSYLYDGINSDDNVVQEQSGGSPTANLLTGAPGQIFQFTTPSGTNSSLLTSRLGTTMALASSAGAITTSYSYTPSGAVTASGASSPNTFEYDATQNTGTGLYAMGERSYNPSTGTFMSQDPTGFNSGTDLYQFTNDDPIDFNDPTGCGSDRDFCVSTGTLLGALALTGLFLVGFLAFSFIAPVAFAALALGDFLGILGLGIGTGLGLGGFLGNWVANSPGTCPE